MKAIALIAAAALASVALPAAAQTPGSLCPAGTAAGVVRLSTVKSTGSMDGFLQAVKDHLKWYRDHGYKTNEIATYPVLERPAGGAWTMSKTQVLSIHKNAPGVPTAQQDDAWKAYVAEYRANSDITSESYVCLPK